MRDARHRLATVLVVTLVLLAALGLARVRISALADHFLAPHSSQAVGLSRLSTDFGLGPGEVIAVLPAAGVAALDAAQDVAAAVAAIDGVVRVSLFPSGTGFDGAAAVVIGFSPEMMETDASIRTKAALDAAMAETQAAHPGVRLAAAGEVSVAAGLTLLARRDLSTLAPLALVAATLVIGLGTGSGLCTLGTSLVTVCAASAGIGLMGWLGIALNPMTAGSPVVVMIVAASSSIHLCIGWKRRRLQGIAPPLAAAQSLAENVRPICLANLTTVLGFLSLGLTPSPPLRELGLVVACGVIFGWMLVLTLLPALLGLGRGAEARRLAPVSECIAGLGRLGFRGSRPVLGTTLLLAALSASGLFGLRLEDRFVNYFPTGSQLRTDAGTVAKALGYSDRLFLIIGTGPGEDALDPAFLIAADGVAPSISTIPGVAGTVALPDLLRATQARVPDGGSDFPESRALIAQYLLLYQLSGAGGPPVDELVTPGRDAIAIWILLNGENGQAPADVARDILNLVPEAVAERSLLVGRSLAFNELTGASAHAMVLGGVAMLALSVLIMAGALRSVRLGLIALVPNILPVLLAYGIWGLVGQPITLGAVIVVTLTFGLVLDDTIHLLVRYHAHEAEGLPARDAFLAALIPTGYPIVLTSLGLIAGFLILSLSDFVANRQIGSLTAMAIAWAVLADLMVLPALLKLIGGRRC